MQKWNVDLMMKVILFSRDNIVPIETWLVKREIKEGMAVLIEQ